MMTVINCIFFFTYSSIESNYEMNKNTVECFTMGIKPDKNSRYSRISLMRTPDNGNTFCEYIMDSLIETPHLAF